MKYPPEFTLNCRFWGDFYQRLELKGGSQPTVWQIAPGRD